MLNLENLHNFLNGESLLYKTRSHSFSVNNTVARIAASVFFENPSLFNLKSLQDNPQGRHDFLAALDSQYEDINPLWLKESDQLIKVLSSIDDPEVKATINKIQNTQNLFKLSVDRLDKDSPEFLKKDKETAAKVLTNNPEDLEFVDKDLLLSNPALYEIACYKQPMLIEKVPPSLLKGKNNILKFAINCSNENFFHLKSFLSDDILKEKLDIVCDLLDNYLETFVDLSPSIIRLLPDQILEKVLLRYPSYIAYVPQDLLELKPELCLKVLQENITVLGLIPQNVLLNNLDSIMAAVGMDHDSIRLLPEAVIKNKEFVQKFLPLFLSNIAETAQKEEPLKNTILEFKNPNIRIFIISKFIECLNNGSIINLPKWESTASTTPLFALAIFETWKPSAEEREKFQKYLMSFKSEFKDGAKRQILLNSLFNISASSNRNKITHLLRLIEPIKGEKKEVYLSRTLDGLRTFPLINSSFLADEIDAFPDLHYDTLKNKIIAKFISNGLLKEDQREIFLKTFMASRMPSSIFTYANNLLEVEELVPMLKKFIADVCSGEFLEQRHLNNSYTELLTTTKEGLNQRDLWEAGFSRTITLPESRLNGLILKDSEDWQDLFLCGTEVQGSCQNVNGNAYNTQGLLGYLLDGKIRILTLKEAEDGPIKARCLVKLIKNPEGKAALLVEPSYPFDTSLEAKELKKFAKERADALGLDLYEVGNSKESAVFLNSDKPNAASVEYEDAMFKEDPLDTYKVCNGVYRVLAKKID
jgi:hypothetical protein